MSTQGDITKLNTVAISQMARNAAYRVEGGNVGVLLIHGLCGTPSEMRFVANGLARNGYTVLCPQLAGHGGSIDDLKATNWQDWYDSAKAALKELRETCDTVIVGGLSTGAVLSLMLAADFPDDVHGLALLAPTLWVNGWNVPWYSRLFKLVHTTAIANKFDHPDHFPHGIKDDRIRNFFTDALFGKADASVGLPFCPGGAVLEHRRLVKALMPKINTIEQPTLILHPREDDLADMNNSWHLQRHMRGMVEMVVLNDSYHNVTIDRQRHVVVEKTTAFANALAKKFEQPETKKPASAAGATGNPASLQIAASPA